MKTLAPLKTRDPDWATEDEAPDELPGRPQRQFLNWRSAALMAVIVGAIGFYAGIRVEKGQTGSSTPAAPGSSFPGARAGAGAGSASGSAARGPGSAPGGFAGAGGAGGANTSFGTVSSVSGKYLYITDASGNTIKVQLSSSTQVSKSVSVSKKSVRPGDTVVISGLTNKQGTVVATAVRDSGASGAAGGGSGSSGSSSSGSGTSGSAAVSSLFGSK